MRAGGAVWRPGRLRDTPSRNRPGQSPTRSARLSRPSVNRSAPRPAVVPRPATLPRGRFCARRGLYHGRPFQGHRAKKRPAKAGLSFTYREGYWLSASNRCQLLIVGLRNGPVGNFYRPPSIGPESDFRCVLVNKDFPSGRAYSKDYLALAGLGVCEWHGYFPSMVVIKHHVGKAKAKSSCNNVEYVM